ncbi:MAG: protease modulator HflC [Acidobacteriota bacterium]|jgi:membrane protease subunit HflC
MNPRALLVVLLVVVLALPVLLGSLYALPEWEQVVITRFGEPVGDPVTEPGLHFKVPFIDTVNRFDKRWLAWDGDPNQIPTSDKKYIRVDTFARWRIMDPLAFFKAVYDERGGQSRLDDIIDGKTRDAIASYDLIEVVRSTNREFEISEELASFELAARVQTEIRVGREEITRRILEASAAISPQFGVELVDVRFKRINYVEAVQRSVFDRMISERTRIAERSRSEGRGRSAEIRGRKERDLRRIQSEAYRKSEEIKGTADAKAAAIYAQAYGKDEAFYRFWKTMETFRRTLDPRTTLVLSTDAEWLRFLENAGGN